MSSTASRSLAWHRGVLTTLVVLVTTATAAQSNGHHHPRLSTAHHLNRLVNHVDSSILRKQQRLGGPYSTTFDNRGLDDLVSIREQETHAEDIQDYVNNAPWTRTNPNRQPVINDFHLINLVAENVQRVKREGKCQAPQLRCEAVRFSQYPRDTVFLPRCALLHRCSEDSGCCISDDFVCGPAESEKVDLYFYALVNSRAKMEKMSFMNHTRCACNPRNIIPSCKCPNYFSPKSVDGQCICDCDNGRAKCRRYKKGRRFFPASDIRCVSTNECVTPTCEYGPFLTRQRRCTRRRERERYLTTDQ